MPNPIAVLGFLHEAGNANDWPHPLTEDSLSSLALLNDIIPTTMKEIPTRRRRRWEEKEKDFLITGWARINELD